MWFLTAIHKVIKFCNATDLRYFNEETDPEWTFAYSDPTSLKLLIFYSFFKFMAVKQNILVQGQSKCHQKLTEVNVIIHYLYTVVYVLNNVIFRITFLPVMWDLSWDPWTLCFFQENLILAKILFFNNLLFCGDHILRVETP